MLDMIMKSLLPQLMQDPEIKSTIHKVGTFVTTLDERLQRIERACGIKPADILQMPPQEGNRNADAPANQRR